MMLRLTLRSLIAHRTRLFLTAVAVVAGVAFVAGTLIFSATLNRSFDRALGEFGRGTDTLVRAQKAFGDELGSRDSDRPLPASVLESVRRADGVAKAHGVINGFAAVVDRKGKIVGAEPQVGTDFYADPELSLMRLRSGAAPAAPDEIAIDENAARASGYRIGDRVPVALASGRRTFRLAGIFRYGDTKLSDAFTVTAFQPATAQRLLMDEPGRYSQITVHAKDGYTQEQVRDSVAAALPPGYEAITGKQSVDEVGAPLKDVLKALRTILLAFAVIAVFVGSFIIFNTFSMLVAQRTREMALLRAVGVSRAQVTRAVLGEAIGVGLFGSTLGLVAGGGLAVGLARLMSAVAGEDLPFEGLVVPRAAVIASYSVGLLVTLAAAYVPARRAARVPPVAALRDDSALPARSLRWRAVAGAVALAGGTGGMIAGLNGGGRSALYLAGGGAMVFFVGVTTLSPLLSRPLTWLIGWPFARFGGAVGVLSRRNALRNPRQTAATASALTIGLALIGTVSVITQSMSVTVNRQLDAGLTADYRITGRSQVTPVGPETLAAVERVPGVREVAAMRTARLRMGGEVRAATAGSPARLVAHYRLRLRAGQAVVHGTDVLVSATTADAEHWTVGTAVPGEFQDGAKATFRVAGIYDDVKTLSDIAPSMIIDDAAYRPHAADRAIDRIEVEGASRGALEAALAPWPNVRLQDRSEIKKEAAGGIDLFLNLVLALLVLSVIIAALGIVNTLALSVVERTREIGLLRAVGLDRRGLRRMIRYEAVIISVFGALLGLAIGVVFGVTVQDAMAGDGVTTLAVPYARLGLYVVAAALIGVLAAVWPARRAARLDVLEAITTT